MSLRYEEYKGLRGHLTQHLREVLQQHPYDTVSNFVRFCESYVSWREGGGRGDGNRLREFYRDYDPPMLPGRHTCVGLTCLLETRLAAMENEYPGLKDATYKVGCEEEVHNMAWYCEGPTPPPTCEMEHVLLCVRVRISGRAGVVLLDPGYHVGDAITIMEDAEAPTSGVLKGGTASRGLTRNYRYRAWGENPAFVAWEVHERRGDASKEKKHISVIYVGRPFLSPLEVAERRNLAYPFKSLVARDETGSITCGLYFPVLHASTAHLTLFTQETGRVKVPLTFFTTNEEEEDEEEKDEEEEEGKTKQEEIEDMVWKVAAGMQRSAEELRSLLTRVADLLTNADLLRGLEHLNDEIEEISRLN